VSTRKDDPHPPGYFAKLGAALRSLSRGPVGESPTPTEPEPERKAELSTHRKKLDCPECGAAAIVRDKGNSMMGIGFCGHEWIFKMVKIHCAAGHKFDALDEEGSVHEAGVVCDQKAVG